MSTDKYFLSKGSHKSAEDGRCAMEWTSYLAGEPHSDKPQCVSPVLATFCVRLNDALHDDERQKLRPYLARTIGTRGDGLDKQREWMCADWWIREYLPAWLDLVPHLKADAEMLRSLPPILTVENVDRAMPDLQRARQRAAAAWAAAWEAACAAAWDAAGDTTGAAAWEAACAAAGEAACAAAGEAGRAAARAAAAALAPTVLSLQNSVLSPGGLLDRMLPTEPIVLPVVGEWREVCSVS